jgi:large subunit ribosomal protein L21
MYAIVKTGGKQYRVEEGQALLVERLPESDGANVVLEPLLYVDGSSVIDGEDLAQVQVEARIVAHERGPKLRIVKFKPKRGYKRRTGHRQELTRIEVTGIKLGARRRAASSGTKAATPEAETPQPPADAPPPAGAAAPPAAAAPESPAAAAPGSPAADTPAAAPEVPAPAADAPGSPAADAPAPPPDSQTPPKEDNDGA